MIVLNRNVRGALGKSFGQTFRLLMATHKPDMVVIQEPGCSGSRALNTIRKLGFRHSIVSDTRGFSGGIWIMWNSNELKVKEIRIHDQFIHVEVCLPQECSWFMTAVSASLRENDRQAFFDGVNDISHSIRGAWLLVGDFNTISSSSEQKGGASVDIQKCIGFVDWINRCGLMDLGVVGSRFSWRGPKWQGRDRVFKRLDRALCNSNWRVRFHEAVVNTLPRVHSDHHLLKISLLENTVESGVRPFRFLAAWMKDDEFKTVVANSLGDHPSPLLVKLSASSLKDWNLQSFGNIFREKKDSAMWHQWDPVSPCL